jgi:ribosomal protein L37AE/L43A
MITALLSPRFSMSAAKEWFSDLSSDRPTYDCPNCKKQAMQFYAQIPGERERSEAFRCCACGSTWEL